MRKPWIAVAFLALAAGCGKATNPPPVTEPAPRVLPGLGDPGEPPPPEPFDAGNPFGLDGGGALPLSCCPVTFVLASSGSEGGGRLVGGQGPLAGDGLPLSWNGDAGTWFASACVPTETDSWYVYEIEIPGPDADGGFVTDARVNPFAPQRYTDAYGEVNALSVPADCATFDAGIYAATSAPDAGP